jgi:hypothetical protein
MVVYPKVIPAENRRAVPVMVKDPSPKYLNKIKGMIWKLERLHCI